MIYEATPVVSTSFDFGDTQGAADAFEEIASYLRVQEDTGELFPVFTLSLESRVEVEVEADDA